MASTAERRKTTYRTNARLRAQLVELYRVNGVSVRRQSAFMRGAIQRLFEDDPQLRTVGQGDRLEEYPDVQPLVVDPATEALIERAYRIVRAVDPRADGVMSALVRAAIRNELRRKEKTRAA